MPSHYPEQCVDATIQIVSLEAILFLQCSVPSAEACSDKAEGNHILGVLSGYKGAFDDDTESLPSSSSSAVKSSSLT